MCRLIKILTKMYNEEMTREWKADMKGKSLTLPLTTRMHSSRMRTGRSLTVCCSLLPGGVPGPGGGSPWSRGGLPGPRGVCLVLGGGSPWSRGGSPCQGGFSLPGGGGGDRRPPPVNRITHTCKNITLATTSLRPVTIHFYEYLLYVGYEFRLVP